MQTVSRGILIVVIALFTPISALGKDTSISQVDLRQTDETTLQNLIAQNHSVGIVKGGTAMSLYLITAATNGNIAQVKELIDKGIDVNEKDNDGKTALMFAAFQGHKVI